MRKILSLSAVLFLAAVAGCGRSPTDTVQQYFAAAKDMDVDKMKPLMSKQFLTKAEPGFKMLEAAKKANGGKLPGDGFGLDSVDVKSEKKDGDTAIVNAVAKKKDGTTTRAVDIHLVKEDGEWKVDTAPGM